MLTPLRLPPGVFRNGTKYQSKGRWYEANLVRWSEGVMMPIGGWSQIQTSTGGVDVTDPIRGIMIWRDDSGGVRILYGTKDKVYTYAAGVETDVTITGLTAGGADATLTSGLYDTGNYDVGIYGEGSEAGGTIVEANTWQFDTYGEEPIALAHSDGRILKWDLNVANGFAVVSNAPTSCEGVVVTPERMIVALGAGGDGRYLQWCDQDSETVWTPASDNTAGDYKLPGHGTLMCGRRLPTETLLLTNVDAFAMRFVGGTLIYRVQQVGSNCGAISRMAMTTAEGRAFWMGSRGFFMYEGGFVRPLPCEISDEIFPNLNTVQRSKVASWANSRFHEVWFSYPVSAECDRIVCYNYLEGHWSGPWTLERTSGSDAGPYNYPVAGDASGQLYDHERGVSYLDTDGTTELAPSATSGPLQLGQGDQVMMVREYIPDEDTLGDVDITLYAGLYPHLAQGGVMTDQDAGIEDSQVLSIGAKTDARLTGRYVRVGMTQGQGAWRFGEPRLEVIARGRR